MAAVLLALLLSFTPSPDAAIHQCHAFERIHVAEVLVPGVYLPRMSEPFAVPCVTWQDAAGNWWSRADCSEMLWLVCEVCVEAVDIYGTASECVGIDTYEEDLLP